MSSSVRRFGEVMLIGCIAGAACTERSALKQSPPDATSVEHSRPQRGLPALEQQLAQAFAELATTRNMKWPERFTDADLRAEASHMLTTPQRAGTSADTARHFAFLREARRALLQYRNVKVAADSGYLQFADPPPGHREYHFATQRGEVFGTGPRGYEFSPGLPSALLYERDASNKFFLVGAMYYAPAHYSAEQLDELVPLSLARWHRHINWCLPPLAQQSRWREKRNGRLVFGPFGVNTRRECDALGGLFKQDLAGWMIHARLFDGDDPASVWGGPQMSSGALGAHNH